MPLKVTVEELNQQSAVLTLDGPLTLGSNLKAIEQQLLGLIDKGRVRLLIDMTQVPFVDSSGLGVIVRTHQIAKLRGGAVRLFGVSRKIAELFALTTTDQFLKVDRDRNAGLAALQRHPLSS